MTALRSLPIHETFYAWQGEGTHMGRAAYFIRTFGCPVQCPWCDSAGTWHPKWVPPKIDRIPAEDLANRATESSAEFVVVTGGEPTIHDLSELTTALAAKGLPTHLETSGSFPIRGEFAWITLSPKWQKPPLTENLRRAQEFKLIVENDRSVSDWWDVIQPHHQGQPVWLHPEWSRRDEAAVLNTISEAVKMQGDPFRAGFQIHRLYRVDALDRGARPDVPLGGKNAPANQADSQLS